MDTNTLLYIHNFFHILRKKNGWVGFPPRRIAQDWPFCTSDRGFLHSSFPEFSMSVFANLAPYESMIFLKTYGICFQTNKHVYCVHLCKVFFKCRIVRYLVSRYRNEQECWCSNQSGTRIRGPSLVPKCSGTGLRYQMPECWCRQHWPLYRYPAMNIFLFSCHLSLKSSASSPIPRISEIHFYCFHANRNISFLLIFFVSEFLKKFTLSMPREYLFFYIRFI